MKWRDNMLTTERVSELQDMVLRGDTINLSDLNSEERQIVTSLEKRINKYIDGIKKVVNN